MTCSADSSPQEPAPAPWERLPENSAPAAERLPELNASVQYLLQRTELWMWLLVTGLSIGGTIITLVVLKEWSQARELPPQAAPPPRLWPVLLLAGISCLTGAVMLARCALALRAFCRGGSSWQLERMFRSQFRFWQVGVFGALMLLGGTAMVIGVQVVVKLGL